MKKEPILFQQEFNKLNEDQKKAVTTFDGPVLVVAGPGTGKTQVLTMRIAYILQNEEIRPQNILALTFTESGVTAMKERLIKLIGTTGYYVQIKTFHSFCNDIILEFPDKFSYRTKDFTNLTDIERYKIIRKIITSLPLQLLKPFRENYFYVREILGNIQSLKKEGITPEDFEKIVQQYEQDVQNDASLLKKDGTQGEKFRKEIKKVEKNKEFSLVYKAYQQQLESLGRYDYEDMIMFVVEKIKKDEELLRTLQERYHHFLIDEYQDTNGAQNFVVYQLANFFDNPNLFVVGDDDQSIYRFQGASLENMLYMNDKFTNITTVVLHTNYRSNQTIIDSSTSVIEHNMDRITNPIYGFSIDKKFSAYRQEESKVSLYEFSHGDIENYFLVSQIEALLQQNVDPNQIAIMYRNNKDAIDIMNMLNKKNIPWVQEGGFNVLQDNEISKIIELLKVIDNPDQEDILFRVFHQDAFNIPSLDLLKLSRLAYNHKGKGKKMIDIALDLKKLQEHDFEKPHTIVQIAQTLISFHSDTKRMILLDLVEKVLRELGILDFLLENNEFRTINRLNSLFTFIKKENYKNHALTLHHFLADIEIMESEDISIPENITESLDNGVHLMTAHKSKGLEFEYVFITKCIDGKWGNPKKFSALTLPPNILQQQKLDTIPQNEDERRLFYVAMTRAKKKIFISYAASYPLLNKNSAIPSQFISEIDQSFITKENALPYEQQGSEIIKLLFSSNEQHTNQDEQNFLQSLVQNYRINPVALGEYLTCPRRFQYNHIIRVPQTKSKTQQYGTAVHEALEYFFRHFKQKKTLPTEEILLELYKTALEKELMSEDDFTEVLREGREVLSAYYRFYKDKFIIPLFLERDYNRIHVHFDDIPLSGKIDKIETITKTLEVVATSKVSSLVSTSKVKIIDYKTGRPRSENEIKGLTQTSKGDKKYFYQILFYKLLLELDKELDVKPISGVLDFVYAQKDGSYFSQLEIEYTDAEYEEFKQVLKEAYAKIQQLEFSKGTDFTNCEQCVYRKICWKDTLF